MSFANGKSAQSTSSIDCPISHFLDYQKWELAHYDKDLKERIFHKLNNFSILDVGYTIKWQLWDDWIRKFTHSVYSNEIKFWDQKLHVYEIKFGEKLERTKIAEWNWKNEVKEHIPKYAAIHLAVTVLDHEDGLIKEFFLSWNNFYNVSQIIKDAKPEYLFKFVSETKYTDGTVDDKKNPIYISEAELDDMKWAQAAKYKPRYISILEKVWVVEDPEVMSMIQWMWDELDQYFKEKAAQYNKNSHEEFQANSNESATKEGAYYNPTEAQASEAQKPQPVTAVKTDEEKKKALADDAKKHHDMIRSQEEINIEDLPF